MGKASSAKKVARAARAGGKTSSTRKNIGFPAAVVVLIVLGVGLVVFARGTNPGDGEPRLGDHWHAAYGIYICDRWVTNLSDRGPDTLGIHTHDDGVVHIHPFLSGAAGNAATLGKFFDQVGVKVSDSSIELPPGDPYEGRTYENGETTCGGQEARVVAAHWTDALTAGETEPEDVRTGGISGEHFDENQGAYTLAFLPEGADIPPPPSAAQIEELGAADGGQGQPVEGEPTDSDLPPDEGTPQDPSQIPPAPGADQIPAPDPGEVPGSAPGDAPAPAPTDAPPATDAPAGG